MTDKQERSSYITYKWALTTLISSVLALCILAGALNGQINYPKSSGERLEERVDNVSELLKEIRTDVKILVQNYNK